MQIISVIFILSIAVLLVAYISQPLLQKEQSLDDLIEQEVGKLKQSKKKSEVIICPQCGNQLKESDRFCSQCGLPMVEKGSK